MVVCEGELCVGTRMKITCSVAGMSLGAEIQPWLWNEDGSCLPFNYYIICLLP